MIHTATLTTGQLHASTCPPSKRPLFADRIWWIEVYPRDLKQFTGIEREPFRLQRSQRNHISLALRAFVRLEFHPCRSPIFLFDAKLNIIRAAVQHYIAHPI